MSLRKLDSVTVPDFSRLETQEAMRQIHDYAVKTSQLVIKLNNRLLELESEVIRLKANQAGR